ncbi:MAG: hypothetical protein HY294_05455 [Candidatus Rokubacteria bacterium]|nr:hypothetical protein [Candidatus Rokubacteria bacterium]MBI3825424.1 hypothetical protein [Candidatus Rokubacteria bacterium]
MASRRGAVLALAALALAGCGVRRVEGGVYHSGKGYRVAVPGDDWTVVGSTTADLELRHPGGAGILVNASCDVPTRATPQILALRLAGVLGDRVVVERDDVAVNGRPAGHTVLEGVVDRGGARTRLEAYVMKDDRCVYDLLYAAPPDVFARWRGDFARVVESFTVPVR